MGATDGTLRITAIGWREQFAARAIVVSTAVLFAIGAFLLMRRIAGAFSSPLPATQVFATALVITAWAVVARMFADRGAVLTAAAIGILFLFALACSYPGTRIVDWLVWAAAMFVTALIPSVAIRAKAATHSPSQQHTETGSSLSEQETDSTTEKVLQQLTRIRLEDGHEAIRGLLVGEFAAGERQTTLYVGFCPPFEQLPQVEVNVADDSDATLKLTQVLHNGTQLEVRLPQPAIDALTVAVEFFATDSEAI